MVPANELYSEGFWDVKEALMVQHAVDVFLALLAGLLVNAQLPGLLVLSMQFV